MAHVDRIIRACSQNKALRGKRKYLNTLQQKYLRSKKSPIPRVTWLPTLLPLDSCLACQREPTMLSRLDLVWSTAPPLTPCNNKIRTGIKSRMLMLMMMIVNMRVTLSICCLKHQDIEASNIRQIENTTNIFWRSKYFFWRTPAKHRSMAKCVAALLGWISSGKMSLVTINSCQCRWKTIRSL